MSQKYTRELESSAISLAADTIELITRYHALADERDSLKAEVERLRAALESRDLIIKTLSEALGSDKTLEAFGFDRERIENARRQIAEGKYITLDQLKAELAERATLRGEEASRPKYDPLPPEILADALQDRVHPASGKLISSKPVNRKEDNRG